MDKGTIKLLVLGGGLAALGYYLWSSGLWAQWFGGEKEFTDQAKLLEFCRANTAASATYVDASGTRFTRSCADWIAVNTPAGTTAPPPPPAPTAVYVATDADLQLAEKLRQKAYVNQLLGTDRANIDQWNYILTHDVDANAHSLDMGRVGIVRNGTDDVMDAATFVKLLRQSGVAGISSVIVQQNHVDPYPAWVN